MNVFATLQEMLFIFFFISSSFLFFFFFFLRPFRFLSLLPKPLISSSSRSPKHPVRFRNQKHDCGTFDFDIWYVWTSPHFAPLDIEIRQG
jgi:hypothetical protein